MSNNIINTSSHISTSDHTSGPAAPVRHELPVQLALLIGTETIPVLPGNLPDAEQRASILRQINEADQVLFTLDGLLMLPLAQAAEVLDFLHAQPRTIRYTVAGSNELFPTPLDAILTFPLQSAPLSEVAGWRNLALDMAAVWFPEQLDIACELIRKRLKTAGISGMKLAELKSLAASRIRLADSDVGNRDDATDFLDCKASEQNFEPGERVIRCIRDEYLQYNRGLWQPISEYTLRDLVTRYLRRICGAAVERKQVDDLLFNLRGEILLDCGRQPLPFVVESEEPFVLSKRNFLVFENGVLELDLLDESGLPTFVAQSPKYLIETRLGFRYDPTEECPLWEAKLQEILPRESEDDRRIEILQEFMGWSLLLNGLRHEKCLLLYGSGANGKSTIIGTWEALLGAENVSHVPLEHFGGEFRLSNMRGKYLNSATEMNRLDKIAEGYLKSLTSGEALDVNLKYKSPVIMHPTAKLVFASNELPRLKDLSEGIWRRMIVMPFTRSFTGSAKDTGLFLKLMKELPGILNWALAGLIRLRELSGFTPCGVCDRALEAHRRLCHPIRRFIEERTELAADADVLKQELYEDYRQWCRDNGVKTESHIEFGRDLRSVCPGVTEGRRATGTTRPRTYCGIGLLNQAV